MRMGAMTFPWRCQRPPMPCRRSCCVLGPSASRNHAPVRGYRADTSRTPCDRSCKNAHDISLAAKTHVDAWDGDATSQHVPDDERLD